MYFCKSSLSYHFLSLFYIEGISNYRTQFIKLVSSHKRYSYQLKQLTSAKSFFEINQVNVNASRPLQTHQPCSHMARTSDRPVWQDKSALIHIASSRSISSFILQADVANLLGLHQPYKMASLKIFPVLIQQF